MFRHAARLVLTTLILPATGQAACLTASDLDTGIEVLFSNSDRTVIFRLPEGRTVWEETYAAAGYAARFEGYLGLYPDSGFWTVRSGEPDESSHFERRYAGDAIPPTPDAAGGDMVTTFTEATGDLSPENWTTSDLTLAWAPAPPLVLGDCTYDVIGQEFRIDWQDGSGGGSTAWNMYLPTLGVGFVVAAQSHGGNLIAAAPVAITRLDGL
jgi:hypothetical protein